jgi:hypothetical protein
MTGIAKYNRPAFHFEAMRLASEGHVVLNPATLPDGLSQPEYMDICLAMLRCAAHFPAVRLAELRRRKAETLWLKSWIWKSFIRRVRYDQQNQRTRLPGMRWRKICIALSLPRWCVNWRRSWMCNCLAVMR